MFTPIIRIKEQFCILPESKCFGLVKLPKGRCSRTCVFVQMLGVKCRGVTWDGRNGVYVVISLNWSFGFHEIGVFAIL